MKDFQPVYDAKAVRTAHDPLVKLIRIIFNKRNITTDEHVRLHGNYWNYWNREPQRVKATTHLNNQRSMLLQDSISWKKFLVIILDLLRLEIVELSITVRDNGQVIKYSTLDTPIDTVIDTSHDQSTIEQFGNHE